MRLLLIRYGAIGDSLVITPLIRYLKQQGHEVYMHTSETGLQVLAHNPNVAQYIPYKTKAVPDDKLQAHWEKLAKDNGCEKIINMCESIERAISFHPVDPPYNYTKEERHRLGNKNFYEYAFQHADTSAGGGLCVSFRDDCAGAYNIDKEEGFYRPELFFTEKEESAMSSFFAQFEGKFVILWGLSGSANNKMYPYSDYVIGDLLRSHKDVIVITCGDESCQILEVSEDERVIRKSGKWAIRESLLACKYADLVIAPDTGIIHGSGCFDTPKIMLVGSNTIENITKHFVNDFSIEADPELVPCAPCHRMIYSSAVQCPLDERHLLPKCLSLGINPRLVLEKIEMIIQKFGIK